MKNPMSMTGQDHSQRDTLQFTHPRADEPRANATLL